ncbi:NUDIX domain-containing protein [bacterium]|nr:NUDIX domain-containing protein [bacterium]
MKSRIFVAGIAAEADLLQSLIGLHEAVSAHAAGLVLVTSAKGPWPVAQLQTGGTDGLLLELAPEVQRRLDFGLRSLGLEPRPLHELAALTYVGAGAGRMEAAAPQVLAVLVAAMADILALQGQHRPEAIAARLFPVLVRASSRVRASASPPATLRHDAGTHDVKVAARRQPYAHFFAVEEYDVSWRHFDGTASATVTRAAFLSGDAVTVLPYDPVRDRVLVVEQFRAGPLARGDGQAWQIEAIAGRIDPFESPQEAARREAAEEAGLVLNDLIFVARYYPSPGAVGEYLYSYLAITDLPDGCAGVFGMEDEAEDIRGHLIGFDALMALVASGEIENAPLILTALWLQRERARLR